MQGHRKIKFNLVTGFPDPIERQIAAGTGERRKRRTVYLYAATLRPVGNSDIDSKLRWGLHGNRERGSLLLREASRLREPQTFFRPLQIRIDVKVHVERIFSVEVNRVGELCVFFGARSGAAPQRVVRLAECFPIA